jgi:3-oxoacyl-[acyl-carrier-protein] synthase III
MSAANPAAVVAGLGVYAPPRVVTNDDLAKDLDTSDEWIRTRTGIRERHIADPGEVTSDLAVEAAGRALKSSGVETVDAVVLGTTTPDRICPATAPEVATRLGLGGAAAYDVSAACSSFLYGLASGAGLVAAGIATRVLVIGAETIHRFMDPADRTTAVLFGDGAGAVVLRAGEPGEPGAVGPFDLGSDGALADVLAVDAGGSRLWGPAVPRAAHYLHMDGREVYRHAVTRMVASSRAVLARAGLDIDDVDRLIGHQANARILEAVTTRLGLPPERSHMNLDRYGNTSAASVPLALADAGLHAGERVLMTAFGAGFTWGSALLVWPDIDVV